MKDLVELASQGDREAFGSLAIASIDRLYAVARRIVQDHDRAQDAVQAALLSAWRDLPTLRDHSRFEAWLHRLLVRACYEEARKQRAYAHRVRVLSSEPAVLDEMGSLADRDEVERAFGRLPVEQRAVVVLHFYLGMQLTEVADMLGIPEGTARSRLHYALRLLRATLEADSRPVPAQGKSA